MLATHAGSWDTDGGNGGVLAYDSDFVETYVGTDARQPCSLTGSVIDEPLDAWLFDINGDQKATLSDVLAISPYFNALASTAAARRFDWNANGFVGLSDVLRISVAFNKTCSPLVGPK